MVSKVWAKASWDDYVFYRNQIHRPKVHFYAGYLQVVQDAVPYPDISDLTINIFGAWFRQHSHSNVHSLRLCLLELSPIAATVPDLVLYLKKPFSDTKTLELDYLDLHYLQIPDLVGDILDLRVADELDRKKQLHSALGIPEYWVIDMRGSRVFAFLLQADGKYQLTEQSQALKGLPVDLLEQTIAKLESDSNISEAQWFNQQVISLRDTE